MTKLVGILNLTPDSFSGDGKLAVTPSSAIARVDAMIEQGAAVIDVGAESTRPGAAALTDKEEWDRLEPFMNMLGARVSGTVFSIDTYHPENAVRALDYGFSWVNDVSGGKPAMLAAIRPYDATLVLMHSLSVPADLSITISSDADPVDEVMSWGHNTLRVLAENGIEKQRVILDPGVGFGKTAAQSRMLIQRVAEFKAWGVPLLVGHSRKSFLWVPLGAERDAATLAVSLHLASQQVDFIRVHDVAAHKALFEASGALA